MMGELWGACKCWELIHSERNSSLSHRPLRVDIPSVPISSANTQSPSSSRSSKSSRKFPCEFCGDELGTKQSLEAHIRAKHEGWRVRCPGCGSSFSFSQALQRHLREERCPSPNFWSSDFPPPDMLSKGWLTLIVGVHSLLLWFVMILAMILLSLYNFFLRFLLIIDH